MNFLVGTHNYLLQPSIQLRILKGDIQKVFVVFFWFLHLHREPANPAELESTTHIATRETASSQTELRNNLHISDIFITVIFITKTKLLDVSNVWEPSWNWTTKLPDTEAQTEHSKLPSSPISICIYNVSRWVSLPMLGQTGSFQSVFNNI